jgi:hypothetical protein
MTAEILFMFCSNFPLSVALRADDLLLVESDNNSLRQTRLETRVYHGISVGIFSIFAGAARHGNS